MPLLSSIGEGQFLPQAEVASRRLLKIHLTPPWQSRSIGESCYGIIAPPVLSDDALLISAPNSALVR